MFSNWANFLTVCTMHINVLSLNSCKSVLHNLFTSIRQRVREFKNIRLRARTHAHTHARTVYHTLPFVMNGDRNRKSDNSNEYILTPQIGLQTKH